MKLYTLFFLIVVANALVGQNRTSYFLADLMPVHNDSLTCEQADTNSRFYFKEEDYKDSLPVYIARYGKNVDIPDSLQLPFYVALSHFPELQNARIEVKSKTMFTTMQARPSNASIFKKRSSRRYNIYINDRKGKDKGIPLSCLNFNARVGFFGHELAHLLDYESRSGLNLIGVGLKYSFSKKYKRHTERETDMQAIRHPLGYALYESKMCILHGDKEEVPPAYKANAREHYMSDNEILDWIRKLRNKPVAASIY